MNKNWTYIIQLACLILLMADCRKEADVLCLPEINGMISPEIGLTTTVFEFDFSNTIIEHPDQDKLFFKWDWNNDGLWDVPFSNKMQYQHRYLIAGKHLSKVMIMDLNGLSDTAEFEVDVAQGYSKPKPRLVITPSTGSPYTQFVLDASGTKDDEDSIETLQFRWDLNGDGAFDIPFGDSCILHHRFTELGIIRPIVEVKDTMGLTAQISGKVEISLWDSTIVADFSWVPTFPVTGENVVFDAALSHDSLYPDKPMQYRWDWNNDRIFDTPFRDEQQSAYVFEDETKYTVRLQVKNYRGLINEVVKEIKINHRNQAPTAFMEASTIGGNTNTKIRFDLWGCRDLEESPSQLWSRWDWNGDGIWDTDYAHNMEVFHTFSEPGVYPVQLAVMDAGGLTAYTSKKVYIGSGTNETDILLDKRGTRGYEYYGIVKIGDQWWFTKNLQVRDADKYSDQAYVLDYGCLYPSVTTWPLCPEGWRIPTKEDWQKLFDRYDPQTLYQELMPGGQSGFSFTLAGLGDTDDEPASYIGQGKYGHYWSQTKLHGDAALSHWIVTFDDVKHRVLPGFNKSKYWYAVRCMKDAK